MARYNYIWFDKIARTLPPLTAGSGVLFHLKNTAGPHEIMTSQILKQENGKTVDHFQLAIERNPNGLCYRLSFCSQSWTTNNRPIKTFVDLYKILESSL